MAEEKIKTEEKKERKSEEKRFEMKADERGLIRILSTDIPATKSVYSGLTSIKGVSWAFSNAICKKLNIDRKKKINELNEKDIELLTKFIKSPEVPEFLLNRRKDIETGKGEHLIGPELDMRREFDIKRMKKIKSYKGIRHLTGQPVRGQRTKSHFRKNKTVGVMGKKKPEKKA